VNGVEQFRAAVGLQDVTVGAGAQRRLDECFVAAHREDQDPHVRPPALQVDIVSGPAFRVGRKIYNDNIGLCGRKVLHRLTTTRRRRDDLQGVIALKQGAQSIAHDAGFVDDEYPGLAALWRALRGSPRGSRGHGRRSLFGDAMWIRHSREVRLRKGRVLYGGSLPASFVVSPKVALYSAPYTE